MKAYPTLQYVSSSIRRRTARVVLLAIVCKIDAEIHEVVQAKACLVNDTLQHGLVDFVWNVAQHDLS